MILCPNSSRSPDMSPHFVTIPSPTMRYSILLPTQSTLYILGFLAFALPVQATMTQNRGISPMPLHKIVSIIWTGMNQLKKGQQQQSTMFTAIQGKLAQLLEDFDNAKEHFGHDVTVLRTKIEELVKDQVVQQSSERGQNQKHGEDVADLRKQIATLARKLEACNQIRADNLARLGAPITANRKNSCGPPRSRIVPHTTRLLRSANNVWVIEVQKH